MLELPDSIEVTRSEVSEQVLLDRCREWLEKDERKPGLHASDLLDPRLAYFKKKNPAPIPDRLVNMFIIGKFGHIIVLSAADKVRGINMASDEGSVWSEDLGIWYSADKTINGVPRELKTTRSFFEAKTLKDVALYVEQLMIYMVGNKSTTGQLWILYMNLKDEDGVTSPAWRVFTITCSEEDLEKYRVQLKATAKSLNTALQTGRFQDLEPCRPFKCGPGPKGCEFWEQCKPEGRYPKKTKTSWER